MLNMFGYTGGFSVYALRAGANLVHTVDASKKATELSEENVSLNFPSEWLRLLLVDFCSILTALWPVHDTLSTP